MGDLSIPFYTGDFPAYQIPLARYLPPIQHGAVSKWLEDYYPTQFVDQKRYILDPFGASPILPIEIVNAGHSVVVTINNPIQEFILKLLANPPSIDLLTRVLAELSSFRKGDDRLEPYIQGLYSTTCDQCGSTTPANSFIWEKNIDNNAIVPISRVYTCPRCNYSGEMPIIADDLQKISKFTAKGPQYSYALEQIIGLEDVNRDSIEGVLEIYLPRSLHALVSILNCRDRLMLRDPELTGLNALLLVALDQVNALWAYPTSRPRPKQIYLPTKFQENNFWHALENSLEYWKGIQNFRPNPIEVTHWPNTPTTDNGICIFTGKFRDLISHIPPDKIGAVITALPRPNQAFWMLSAAWTGWLWGKKSVQSLKSVIRRKKFDWAWHTYALYSTLKHVNGETPQYTPFFGIIGETEPGYINSVMIAADLAGFQLVDFSYRSETSLAQINWLSTNKSISHDVKNFEPDLDKIRFDVDRYEQYILKRNIDYLRVRGEPVGYQQIHANSLCHLVSTLDTIYTLDKPINSFPNIQILNNVSISDVPTLVNQLIEDILHSTKILRLGGTEKSIETGQYWISDDEKIFNQPLSDSAEKFIYNYLITHLVCPWDDLDQTICNNFRGLLTPSSEFNHICLESYAHQLPTDKLCWTINEKDMPEKRRQELENYYKMLKELAKRLQFVASGSNPIKWYNLEGSLRYVWYLTASAIFSDIILTNPYPECKSLILLPGGRANLVAHKLRHDLRLNSIISKGWRFIKFRQIRSLAENVVVNNETFEEQLNNDTLSYNAPQLRIF